MFPFNFDFCSKHCETSTHLFFEYAFHILSWFSSILNIPIALTNIWGIRDRGWGAQCKLVIIVALINIVNSI
jgi:hypothetical protein